MYKVQYETKWKNEKILNAIKYNKIWEIWKL